MKLTKTIIIVFVTIVFLNQALKSQVDTTFYDLNYTINNFSQLKLKNDTLEFSNLDCWNKSLKSEEIIIKNIESLNLKVKNISELNKDSILTNINDTLSIIFTSWANEFELFVFEIKVVKIEDKRYIVKFKELETNKFYKTTTFYEAIRIDTLKEVINKLNCNNDKKARLIENDVDLGKEDCRVSTENYYFIISDKNIYGFWQRVVYNNSDFFQNLLNLFEIDNHLKK